MTAAQAELSFWRVLDLCHSLLEGTKTHLSYKYVKRRREKKIKSSRPPMLFTGFSVQHECLFFVGILRLGRSCLWFQKSTSYPTSLSTNTWVTWKHEKNEFIIIFLKIKGGNILTLPHPAPQVQFCTEELSCKGGGYSTPLCRFQMSSWVKSDLRWTYFIYASLDVKLN